MIQITITSDDSGDAIFQFDQLAVAMGYAKRISGAVAVTGAAISLAVEAVETKTASEPIVETTVAPEPETPEAEPVKEKKTKAPKGTPAKPEVIDVTPDTEAEEAPDVKKLEAGVREIVQAFVQAKRVAEGFALLQEFGATSVSKLKPEHYVEFTAKAKKQFAAGE